MTRMLPRNAVLLAFALFAATPAAADVLFPARTSIGTIQYTRPDFSDVVATQSATVQVPAGASGTRSFTFYTGPNLQAITVTGTGDVAADIGISYLDPDPQVGYAQVDGAATVTGPLGGGFTLTEIFGPSTIPDGPPPFYRYADSSVFNDPAYSYLPPFTQTGLPVFEYFLPFDGANLVDEGGSYTVQLLIAGDYSTTGGLESRSGQHFLSYINPDFAITEDFVYDPVTNRTRFTAVNATYSYLADDPTVHLDIFFFGSAVATGVPEPASWAMMIGGMGLVGGAIRRRRGGGQVLAAI